MFSCMSQVRMVIMQGSNSQPGGMSRWALAGAFLRTASHLSVRWRSLRRDKRVKSTPNRKLLSPLCAAESHVVVLHCRKGYGAPKSQEASSVGKSFLFLGSAQRMRGLSELRWHHGKKGWDMQPDFLGLGKSWNPGWMLGKILFSFFFN